MAHISPLIYAPIADFLSYGSSCRYHFYFATYTRPLLSGYLSCYPPTTLLLPCCYSPATVRLPLLLPSHYPPATFQLPSHYPPATLPLPYFLAATISVDVPRTQQHYQYRLNEKHINHHHKSQHTCI